MFMGTPNVELCSLILQEFILSLLAVYGETARLTAPVFRNGILSLPEPAKPAKPLHSQNASDCGNFKR